MPSSVAPGAVETESKWAENSTASSIYKLGKKPHFDIDEALTFSQVIYAVDFYEDVVSFEVYSSCATQVCRIRLDIIFNVDKVDILCYFP